MNNKEFSSIELETHETKDVLDNHINGELTIIWRDWDEIINQPQMIYLNSVNPREIKGPHIHKNRTSYFFCLEGKLIIVIQDSTGKYHEIEINSKNHKLISVSNGIAAAIVNPTTIIAKVLVLADIAWKPNDNEMENIDFKNYDLKKWK